LLILSKGRLILWWFIDWKCGPGKGCRWPIHIYWDRYKGNIEDVITNHSDGIETEGTEMGGVRPFSLKWRRTLIAGYIVNGRGDQKEGK
jgi:hypothetical protein